MSVLGKQTSTGEKTRRYRRFVGVTALMSVGSVGSLVAVVALVGSLEAGGTPAMSSASSVAIAAVSEAPWHVQTFMLRVAAKKPTTKPKKTAKKVTKPATATTTNTPIANVATDPALTGVPTAITVVGAAPGTTAGASATAAGPIAAGPIAAGPTAAGPTAVSSAMPPPVGTGALVPAMAPAVFAACRDSKLECATVAVPLDPANPTGERIDLFVSRRKATGPAPRIGVLLVNPGGPGGPTYDTVRSAASFLTPEVLERFDVIGVDPRGTERSAPLKCDIAAVSRVGANGARLSFADAIANTCSTADGPRLVYMDTQTAARDLDAVRLALGEQRISFLGMSYGTYLGAVYRAQFPERVRSMILDSAVDPMRFGNNMLLDPIAATEKALDGFLDECASGRLSPCAFNDGTDLRAKYLRVREAFVQDSALARPRAEQSFDETIASLVGYPRNGWPILGRALQELAKTGSGTFRVMPGDNQSVADPERISSLDSFSSATNLAINCRDGILPRDPAADQQIRDAVPVVGPRFSGLFANSVAADSCVNWGAAVVGQTPLGPQVSAPTLVIGNTFDLTTPYVWSQGLAAELQSPLLTRNGGGHVAVTKSPCIREASARFLIDNSVPAPGTICSPSLSNPS